MTIVDLTHIIYSGMPTYPSDPEVNFITKKTINKNNSLLHSIEIGTHTGTHLDTPAHIIQNGKTLENFELTSFTGITIATNKNSWKKLAKFKDNIDGIIFNTNWYKHFGDPELFYCKERPEIPEKLINIAIEKNIKFFGTDLPSVDKSGSKEKPIHNALLNKEIIIYEGLNNLDQIPELKKFNFFGFPLNLKSLDGSPVRAVAII